MTQQGMLSGRRYTVAISKGAAAIAETRALLELWTPGETAADLLRKVQQTDALGKATDYRTRDLVVRVFRPRLLTPTDGPARALKLLARNVKLRQTFRELLFLYAARADSLLYDFTVQKYWPACRAGEVLLPVSRVVDFIDKAAEAGALDERWSEQVTLKVARGILGALRDFGFLHEERRSRREVHVYRMTDVGVAYLAYELHGRGLSDMSVTTHPDWSLFGLDHARVLDRLDSLPAQAGIVLQRAGSVVRMTWIYVSAEALLNAVIG